MTHPPRMLPGERPRELGAFELRFEPCAALISVVRRFVTDFYREVLHDEETVSEIALATHELLENTVKYSTDGRARLSISVGAKPDQIEVRVRTCNEARPSDVAELERKFDAMANAADAFEHYHAEIRQSIAKNEGSGLGLARIHAEAQMRLALGVQGTRVEITAERWLPLAKMDLEVSCNP